MDIDGQAVKDRAREIFVCEAGEVEIEGAFPASPRLELDVHFG
jgi:hypothetical protein